ncbi:hypothetical protein Tco_0388693, partial [Tanacetum coccineum]
KINTWAERQADNKRKSDDTARNNQNQQLNKRHNTGRAYATGNGGRRPYRGPRPLKDCPKWKNNNNPTGNIRLEMPRLSKGVCRGQSGATPTNNVGTVNVLPKQPYASILFDTVVPIGVLYLTAI